MTHLNNQVISCLEKKVIAETVHETLSEFCDELKPTINGNAVHIDIKDILEGSCFYYAALGAEVCTRFYQQKFNDTESSYQIEAGAFALRHYKDKTQTLKWFRYGGELAHNKNDYHCWVIGPVPIKYRKFEVIDFTAMHYKKQVHKIPNLSWEREDLENVNFIWNNNYQYVDKYVNFEWQEGYLFQEYDLVFSPIEYLNTIVSDEWKQDSIREKMMKKSEEILSYKLSNLSQL
jgi:hypothetical protein